MPQVQHQQPQVQPTPVPVVQATPLPGGEIAPPPATPTPVPIQMPPIPTSPTSFLNKELPKIGIILGPGGMKAYAHIGILREFARARIPIRAIVGVEWGAVIGAMYAQQGQANDAEWRAFKLREKDLPSEGGFLSSRPKAQSVALLSDFFETAFGNSAIESAKVDFACPAYWSRVDRFGWMGKGLMKEAMRACVPYPPMFADNAGVTAAPFSVDDAVVYLRAHGADLIVIANVLAPGEFMSAKKMLQADSVSDNVLWSEIRREMVRPRSPNVQFVINVNTAAHPLTDYAGRRALMELGAKASADTVAKLISQYGF